MYVLTEGDSRYLQSSQAATENAQTALSKLQHSELPKQDKQKILQLWNEINNDFQHNTRQLKNNGYSDLQTDYQIIRKSEDLINLLEPHIQYSEENIRDIAAQQSHRIQAMTLRYVVRSSSASIGISSIATIGKSIDELAREFSQEHKKLLQTEDKNQAIKSVTHKWKFIKKSLVNYGENNVPMLVRTYCKNIVKQLAKII